MKNIILGLLLGLGLSGWAQPSFNLAFMPEQGEAQWQQPAWLLADSSEQLRLGGGFGYRLASNAWSTRQITGFFGPIDENQKAQLLAGLDTDNRLELGQRYSLLVNARRGPWLAGLSYRRRQRTWASLDRPDLAGLVLYGNARYVDQTLEGSPALDLGTYDEVGLALGYQAKAWQAAVRIKLLLGQEYLSFSEASFSLYTSPLGEYLDLAGTYQFFQTQGPGLNGLGVGLDAGVVYRPDDRWTLQAALLDGGAMVWQGNQRETSFDFRYEGADLGGFNFDEGLEFRGPDSLLERIWPDSVAGQQRMPLPARVQAGASYRLAPAHRVQGVLAYGGEASSLDGFLAYAGYQYQFASWGGVGLSGFYGGTERYGLGIFGQAKLPLAEGTSLRLFFSGDNVLGLLRPEHLAGLGLQIGAAVGF